MEIFTFKGKNYFKILVFFLIFMTAKAATAGLLPAIHTPEESALKSKAYRNGVGISISNDSENQFLRVGSTIVFTVRVNNLSSGALGDTEATFTLPSGYEYVSHVIKTGTTTNPNAVYNPLTGTWPIGTVNYSNNTTNNKFLYVTAKVLFTGSHNYSASVTAVNSNGTTAVNASTGNNTAVAVEPFAKNDNTLFSSLGNTTTGLYTVDQNNGSGGSTNYMHTLLNSGINGISYNSLAFNSKDGYLYAMRYSSVAGQNSELYYMGKDGVPHFLKDIPNLPMGTSPSVCGEIDPDGNYYIRAILNGSPIHKINLQTYGFTTYSMPNLPYGNDLAWKDNFLYTVTNNGKLYKINLSAGSYKDLGVLQTGIGDGSGSNGNQNVFGALYSHSEKDIFGSLNNGSGFYRINVDDPFIGNRLFSYSKLQASGNNDGAHNVTEAITFNSDLKIELSKPSCYAPGGEINYTVTVTNTGGNNVRDAKVHLAEWLTAAGIPIGNLSYTVALGAPTNSYTVNAGGVSSVNLTNNNDAIAAGGLPTITFSVTVTIPASVTGSLTLTANVVAPADIIDPDSPSGEPNSASQLVDNAMPINGATISKNTICLNETAPTLSSGGIAGNWTSMSPLIATVTPQGIITIIAPGTVQFNFTPSVASACPPNPVNLTILPVPNKPTATFVNPTCTLAGIITVASPSPGANISYTLTPTDPTVATKTQDSPIFNNLIAGTYLLTATFKDSSCPSEPLEITLVADINIPPAPKLTLIQPTCNVPTGTITVDIPTVDPAKYKFTLTSTNPLFTTQEQNTNVFSGLAPGIYLVTVTDIITGCTNNSGDQILEIKYPIANAGTPFTKTCSTNINGKEIGAPTVAGLDYSWSPALGLSSTTIANPTANPTVTTTYTLTVTNPITGCTATASVIVTVDNALPTANAGTAFTKTCSTNLTGKEIGAPTVAGLTYSWSPALGLSSTTIANPIANPNVTTTYTLTVTNPITGCTATASVIATVSNTPPTADVGTAFTKTCIANLAGKEIGAPTVAGLTYSWSPALGLSSTTIANPIANPDVTTTYTLTVTNPTTGCTDENQIVITVDNTLPTANAGTAFTKTCSTNIDGKEIGAPTVSGLTYSWSPALGLSDPAIANPTANPSATTTYTLTVTNAAGCSASSTVLVTVDNTIPTANAGTPFTKTCSTNIAGKEIGATAVAGLTYSWSPTLGLSDPAIANPIANPAVTTTYTLTVTNAAGCSASSTVLVTVDNTIPTANAGTPFTKTCSTNIAGKEIGTPTVAGLTYSWSPALGLSDPAIANPIANPSATTTYTLTVTNAAGCSASSTVLVTVDNTIPTANAGTPFTKTCSTNIAGKEIGATAVAGLTYSWSPALGLSDPAIANPTANPSVTTTYTLTVTNAAGCSASSTVLVTVDNTIPTANAGTPFTKTCSTNIAGKEIGATAVAGLTYSWSPALGLSDPAIANPIANPAVTTTYTLTVTNAAGCSASSTVLVTVDNTIPTANAGTPFTKTCSTNIAGKEIGATAVAGLTYSWSPTLGLSDPAIANPIANPSATTTYTLTVTNAAGCSTSSTVLVTVDNTIPTANAGTPFTKTCSTNIAGKEIGATAVAGLTYSWSPTLGLSDPAIANPIANPAVTTTYTLTVTNAAGCSASSTVLVTVDNTIPTANAGTPFTKTCSTNIAGKEIGTPTVAGLTYSWSPALGLSDPAIANPIANPDVTTTYTLTVTNAAGCSASSTVLVTVDNTIPTANAGTPFTKTCSTNIAGKEIGAPTVAGLTYSWSPTLGLSDPAIANPIANPAVTTTYTLTVTNAAGCSASSTVLVTVDNTIPTANAGTPFTKTCSTNIAGKEIGAPTVAGLSYSWSPTLGLSDPAIANPIANPSATTTYTLTVTNAAGCSASSTVLVTVDNTIPTANAGTPFTKTCSTNIAGKQIGGTPVAGLTYSWSPALGLSDPAIANPIANPAVTTTYTLTVTNAAGCSASSTVLVTVDNTIPTANAGTPFTKTCSTNIAGKEIGAPTVAGLTYSWSPALGLSDPAIANPIANPSVTTTYTLTVSNAAGCSASSTVLVTVDNTIPTANAGTPFTKTCSTNIAGKEIGGTPVAGLTYSWSPIAGLSATNIANPIANPSATTTYTLTVTNAAGCSATASVIVTVAESVKPLLTTEAAICSANGTYSFKFYTNGTITAIGGTISGNTVIATIGTNVSLTATATAGCATNTTTVISPADCSKTECSPPALSAGQPVCNGNGTYSVALNFKAGAIITASAGTVSGNSIINIPVATDVTVTATSGNCTNKITVAAVKDCSGPVCEKAAVSYSAGICLGTTYSINIINPQNAVITASVGTVTANAITGIPVGTAVTLTATLTGGCEPQVVIIQSPSSVKPLLTTEAAICNANGTYSFKFYTNGTVTAIGGTISGNIVTATIGTNVTLTATATAGCATNTATVISPADCSKTECTPPALSAGQPVCNRNGTYSVALNFKAGTIITANAGTVSGNSIINIPIGTDVTITATSGNCTNKITITAVKDCSGPVCEKAAVSYSAGICLGTTYSINITNPQNAVITASAGTVTANAITGIPIGTAVTLTATLTGGCEAQVIVIQSPNCASNPSINLIKTGKFNDLNKDGYAQEGETISYGFLIKNTGDVPLTNINIVDLLPGITITPGAGPFTLNPGESSDRFFTATYIIKQSDIDAGFVFNVATVTGETTGKKVEDESEVKIPLIKKENCLLTVYNTLTPNNDGKNDFFKIDGLECAIENRIEIFNRWGVLVFERDNYNNSDRAFKGMSEGRVTINQKSLLPTGVYFYILKYKDSKGQRHSKSGSLYLTL